MPNIAGNKYKDDSLTSGELIRKAKVTPKGISAPTNPIKRVMEEQEQNGVITPKRRQKGNPNQTNASW